VGVGPAGTGKTYIPCSIAAEMLIKKKIKKILITRPAVNVDESHGFLPGDIESKMMPYMKPIYDCFVKSGVSKETIRTYLKNEIIEICPLSYIRGRTFSDCFLLADETQNCTINQMKMLLTRIGQNCKVVMTGDTSQSDLPTAANGLADLIERLEVHFESSDESCIDLVRFHDTDVVRSKVVREILKLYENK
jgi:phosphate starvation-inducible PhoH-like protein